MTTKMKGLLKGLRYISQIFDDEKEPEMMIGNPTDVKHVAHIGWDGPSVTSPSWMNEFKSLPRHSAPLDAIDKDIFRDDPSDLQDSEVSNRGGRSQSCQSSPARELPDIPKSTRQHSSTTSGYSPTKAKSEKLRQPRKSSKSGKDAGNGTKQNPEDGIREVDSPTRRQLPDAPKKSRRKKSKESGGGSTRSSLRSKTKASSDHGGGEGTDQQHLEGGSRRGAMEDVEEEEEERQQLRGPATSDRCI